MSAELVQRGTLHRKNSPIGIVRRVGATENIESLLEIAVIGECPSIGGEQLLVAGMGQAGLFENGSRLSTLPGQAQRLAIGQRQVGIFRIGTVTLTIDLGRRFRRGTGLGFRRQRAGDIGRRLAAAKARGVSRNDLLMAGFARAFVTFCRGDPRRPLRIVMPVDLRRYAEVESRPAICNLAGVANVFIEPDLGGQFGDTLNRVTREMARHRRSFIGALNPLMVRRLSAMAYARKRRTLDRLFEQAFNKPVPPTFSNVGKIQPRRMRFAGSSPTDVALYLTPLSLPVVLVSATEYRGVMTVTMSYYLDDHPAAEVERFLAGIADGIET